MPNVPTKRQKIIAGTVLGLTTAAILTWVAWPQHRQPPAPRERQYKATTACLLTDDHDLNGEPANTTWAGMQDASTTTLIKIQHLAITGPQTAANGLTYYNTLAIQHCTVIIAAGPLPIAAMTQGHNAFPNIHHVAVGANPDTTPITTIDTAPADTIRTRVKDAVIAAT